MEAIDVFYKIMMRRIKEDWHEANLRARIGMAGMGLGLLAVYGGTATALVSSFGVNGHHVDFGNEPLEMIVGGGVTLLIGQQILILGSRERQSRTNNPDNPVE